MIIARQKKHLTKTQNIALSFFGIILLGAVLLSLPIASNEGTFTDPLTCLFTATSAGCVTGLVVVDTYTHWSMFGKLVILGLIQIGGLGVITVVSLFALSMKKNITLKSRNLLQDSLNSLQIGGIVRLIKRTIKGVLLIEGIGAILLSGYFIPKLGVIQGIWYGIFHSVSAFCNAGFDLMGFQEPYISFCNEADSYLLNLTLIGLIVLGGIGFLVWDDVIKYKFCMKKYTLQTKLVLLTSSLLLFGGTALFWLFEKETTLKGISVPQQFIRAFFASTTARTAGFNTIDLAKMSDSGRIFNDFLMLVGGSPGSTAGGIKTTTIAVLFIFMVSTLSSRRGTNIFHRQIGQDTMRKAMTVFLLNLSLAVITGIAICAMQNIPTKDVLFETFSAIGTVGMSTGITRDLNTVSRILIMLLMFLGRVGSMTFALIFVEGRKNPKVTLPEVDVAVG